MNDAAKRERAYTIERPLNTPGLLSACLSAISFLVAVGFVVWPFVDEFMDNRTLGSALFAAVVGLVSAFSMDGIAAYVAKLADQPRAAKLARLAFQGVVGAVGLLVVLFACAVVFG